MKAGLGALIILGLTGTVYQAGLLRLYLPVQDGLNRQNLGGLGERNLALREVLTGLEEKTPKDAVFQYNTDQLRDFFNFAQLLNTPRQTVNAMPNCNIAFGGNPEPCEGIKAQVKTLYAGPGDSTAGPQVEDAVKARRTCEKLGADELVATKWDPVWRAKGSWVWSLPVVAATERVRIVKCGTKTR